MKLPRGVSANRLVHALEHLGYGVVRQKESHLPLRHPGPAAYTITVPLHNPLKTGTLHGILTEVALMRSVALESLCELLRSILPHPAVGRFSTPPNLARRAVWQS